ncbi:MAG: protein translocase subunit SecF [Phycicoccus sp.]|nr:protein translocase subunit SecF [Phycicoccus sp.]
MSFANFGNDLYSGKRSIPVVAQRSRFYLISLIVIAIAVGGLVWKGLNLGLEFRGGSEFRVALSAEPSNYESTARDAVTATGSEGTVNVTLLGTNTVRVQTERLDQDTSAAARTALAESFNVPEADVSATFIGPSWGASVSQKALQALIIFLLLTALVMAVYFRTWKMALAALLALAHDMVITLGVYALVGFEVTPASMIGFLTVLGYSLYDTVVVFDKVRENTDEAFGNGRLSYAQAANLAVNQTMVRSINTTVVALLPITAILVVGFGWLGPGTLLDLSLVLFIGILVGAYSSIFIATPLLVSLRSREFKVQELAKRAERSQLARTKKQEQAQSVTSANAAAAADEAGPGAVGVEPGETSDSEDQGETTATLTGRAVHKYARPSGPRNQPKRTPRSER